MNYRHVYHAGNFADVFKHILVTRIVDYLKRKDQAFRVIDTHAGIGLYDLSSVAAQKTGEWHDGIGRILAQSYNDEIKALIHPWLDTIKDFNPEGGLRYYPGSPLLVRHLLRKQDRLSAMELHPDDFKTLKKHFEGDYQSKIIHLDGWLALGAHLPPKEKRGLVLVDPPFEEKGEFERLFDGLCRAYRRFSGGIYALWYPIKNPDQIEHFIRNLRQSAMTKILRLEIARKPYSATSGMDGCGMIIVNPPYVLEKEMDILTPFFQDTLGETKDGQYLQAKINREWIKGE